MSHEHIWVPSIYESRIPVENITWVTNMYLQYESRTYISHEHTWVTNTSHQHISLMQSVVLLWPIWVTNIYKPRTYMSHEYQSQTLYESPTYISNVVSPASVASPSEFFQIRSILNSPCAITVELTFEKLHVRSSSTTLKKFGSVEVGMVRHWPSILTVTNRPVD